MSLANSFPQKENRFSNLLKEFLCTIQSTNTYPRWLIGYRLGNRQPAALAGGFRRQRRSPTPRRAGGGGLPGVHVHQDGRDGVERPAGSLRESEGDPRAHRPRLC